MGVIILNMLIRRIAPIGISVILCMAEVIYSITAGEKLFSLVSRNHQLANFLVLLQYLFFPITIAVINRLFEGGQKYKKKAMNTLCIVGLMVIISVLYIIITFGDEENFIGFYLLIHCIYAVFTSLILILYYFLRYKKMKREEDGNP